MNAMTCTALYYTLVPNMKRRLGTIPRKQKAENDCRVDQHSFLSVVGHVGFDEFIHLFIRSIVPFFAQSLFISDTVSPHRSPYTSSTGLSSGSTGISLSVGLPAE